MAESQKKLQALSEEYQKLQTDLQSSITARQRLESQQQENKSVQKEFSTLPTTSNIYKLVGPVLQKQERSEAVQVVSGRLEFIGGEIKRIEKSIKESQEKSEGLKMEVRDPISPRRTPKQVEDIITDGGGNRYTHCKPSCNPHNPRDPSTDPHFPNTSLTPPSIRTKRIPPRAHSNASPPHLTLTKPILLSITTFS